MTTHTAKSLFDQNIQSAHGLLKLYDGIVKLGTTLEITWLLRACVIFSVSALDAYFHDKVKYRAAKFGLQNMPPQLAKFKVPLEDLTMWENAQRKGNVIRNWLVEYFSAVPLQRTDSISDALRLVGIDALWDTIEPNKDKRKLLQKVMRGYIKRHNQIAHEGDRETSRTSGKKLRSIDRKYAVRCTKFFSDLVTKVEADFPK